MSSRSIAFRLLAVAALATPAPGCGGTSGSARPDDAPAEGPLKICYFRTNFEVKTKRPEPTLKVFMSSSWKDMFGESPRDPLTRAAPKKVFKGTDADIVLVRYIRQLRGLGLDSLKSANADDANWALIHQMATSSLDRDHPRIITVGTDKASRSYAFHEQKTEEQARTFIACEKLVSAIMDGHVMYVTIDKGGGPDK